MEKVPVKSGRSTYMALVDDEDYGKVCSFKWRLDPEGYAVCTAKLEDGSNKRTTYRMHRMVMNNPTGWEVDHVSRNRLDNRKANLRLCTSSQNKANQSIRQDNKSGSKGVSWNSASSKWVAKIYVNKKCIFLGRFSNKTEGIEAYNQAQKKYYGEFANNK